MPLLVHCIYVSTAAQQFGAADLDLLLKEAREENLRLGVTGILLFMAGRFFQILEGKPDVVRNLYASIARDPRHMEVTQIIFETIHARSFEDWSMGLVDLSGDKLTQIITLSNPSNSIVGLSQLPDGRAKKLIQAFCEGRWGPTITDLSRLTHAPLAA